MNILIPVDFSNAAQKALNYAILFANKMKAELVVLHAQNELEEVYNSIPNAEENMTHFLDGCNLETRKTSIKTEIFKMELNKAIHYAINKHTIDLIVMGTKGKKGLSSLFSGTHTTDLLSEVKTPILVVPEQYSLKEGLKLSKILFASDFKPILGDNAFDPLVNIANVFESEIRIAHVYGKETENAEIAQLERSREHYLMEELQIKHSFKRIHRSDISEGIVYYLNLKKDNDLLVFIRREHGFLSRIFRRDHAEIFTLNPPIPLLVLHE